MPYRNFWIVLLSALLVCVCIVGCGGGKSTLRITGTLPSSGTVNTAYGPATLTASGGTGSFTWTVSNLPSGVAVQGPLSGASITISGTPTAEGTFMASATVTDTNFHAATLNVTITIAAAGALTVTTTSLPGGTVGTAYPNTTLAATGGTTPYTWTEKSGGDLPAGLMLTGSSGLISGTPTAAGTFGPYVFTVTDHDGTTANSPSMTIVITGATGAACAPNPTPRGNEAALTAPFAFLLAGSFGNNEIPVSWAGSITPNGNGGISAGSLDFTSFEEVFSLQVKTVGSSYSYGSDGRGCLYLSFGPAPAAAPAARLPIEGNANRRYGNSRKMVARHPAGVIGTTGNVTFSFSLGQSNKSGRIEQFDYPTSAVAAAGNIHIQTPDDFSLSKLATHFAFGAAGWLTATQVIVRASIAGSATNNNGTLMNSFADDNVGGVPSGGLSGGSGTLGEVSSTTGRGVGSYTIQDNGSTLTFNFAYYVLNHNDFLIISTDDPAQVGVLQLTGQAIASSSSPPIPNGFYMFGSSGFETFDLDNLVAIGTIQLTSSNAVPTATIYQNDEGVLQKMVFTNGSYALETASGRVTLTGVGTEPPVSYLTANNSEDDIVAFLVGTDLVSSSGFLMLQTTSTPNFGAGDLSGSYALGTTEDVAGVTGSLVGTFTFDGENKYSAIADIVIFFDTTLHPNQTFTGVTAIKQDGSGDVDNGSLLFVTDGTNILAIDGDGVDEPFLYVGVKQ
jgi:hypothetical protein